MKSTKQARLSHKELKKLKERIMSFLRKIVKWDEKQICHDAKHKKHWVYLNEARKSLPKHNIHSMKVLLCLWWDVKIMLYHEVLLWLQLLLLHVTRYNYCNFIRKLIINILVLGKKTNLVKLYHDNIRLHVAKMIKYTLVKYFGVQLA